MEGAGGTWILTRRSGHELAWAAFLAAALVAVGGPVDTLVVVVHELGHLGAAWLTGAEILGHGVHDDVGHTVTRGGWPRLILGCGYIAPALLGASLGLVPARGAVRLGLLVGALTLLGLALKDIVADASAAGPTDAVLLASVSPLPPLVWTALWALFSLVLVGLVVWRAPARSPRGPHGE